MKKLFLMVIMFFILLSCSNNDNPYTDLSEPNNSFKNALFIKCDGKYIKGSIDSPGGIDYYQFYARSRKNSKYVYYHFKFRWLSGDDLIIVSRLYNIEEVIKNSYFSDASTDLNFEASFSDGAYFLTVSGYDDTTGDYELSIAEYYNY